MQVLRIELVKYFGPIRDRHLFEIPSMFYLSTTASPVANEVHT